MQSSGVIPDLIGDPLVPRAVTVYPLRDSGLQEDVVT